MAHEHGSMDITEQEKTFAGFIRYGCYLGVAAVVVLLILTTRI